MFDPFDHYDECWSPLSLDSASFLWCTPDKLLSQNQGFLGLSLNSPNVFLYQAYKALTVARDLNGEEFEIFRLVDALKDCDKYELAERTLDILDCECFEPMYQGYLDI